MRIKKMKHTHPIMMIQISNFIGSATIYFPKIINHSTKLFQLLIFVTIILLTNALPK